MCDTPSLSVFIENAAGAMLKHHFDEKTPRAAGPLAAVAAAKVSAADTRVR
jgi:hypothetical protein